MEDTSADHDQLYFQNLLDSAENHTLEQFQQFLEDNKSQIHLCDRYGRNGVYHVSKINRPSCLQILLRYGGNPNDVSFVSHVLPLF